MSYCTAENLSDALEAASLPAPPVTPTEQQVASALSIADSRINLSVRAGNWTLHAPYSASIVDAATALALWNLLLDARRNPRTLTTVKANYDSALKYLDGVATRKTNPST